MSSDRPPTFFDPSDPTAKLFAEVYEGHMVPALFLRWGEALVEQMAVAPGDRVLDIACGSGAVTRVLARAVAPGGSVVGVDLSPVMLGLAEGLGLDGVEFHEGDATSLPVEDGGFDVAVCQQGLQFFPDRAASLAEMHRALKPGGRVGISCWRAVDDQPFFKNFDDAVEAVGLKPGTVPNVPLSFPDAGALQEAVEAAGFTDVQVERQERASVWPDYPAYIRLFIQAPPFSAIFAGADDDTVTRFVDELLNRLEPYRTENGHEIPWASNVATARRPE